MTVETNKLRIDQEIEKVTDAKVQEFLRAAVELFPDYFWTVPASAGKYHHPDEREKGGLVLHVRRLCALVEIFVRMHALNFWEKDVLIAAAILHDSFARGVPPNHANTSVSHHPLYPRQQFPFNGFADRFISSTMYEEIMECVESHMGRWSVTPMLQSKRKLPMLFQTIDHIGSRENIKIDIF